MNDLRWEIYNGKCTDISNILHIFCIDVDHHFQKITSLNILSIEEINKSKRFLRDDDRKRYLVRKYFLRVLLSRFLDINPIEITYTIKLFGKPVLNNICFNTSSSNKLIVIMISNAPVGIDIEFVKRNFNFHDLLEDFFSEEEISFIINGPDQSRNFHHLWTRKESILKVTGEGLVDDLHSVPIFPSIVVRDQNIFRLKSFFLNEYVFTIAYTPQDKQTYKFWNSISIPD